MTAKAKHKQHQAENGFGDRERRRRDMALDEALKDTFPASDPVSVEQPVDGIRIEEESSADE
jgi:hypothetical protein